MMIRMSVPTPMYTVFSFSSESGHSFPLSWFVNPPRLVRT